jgi:tetratricopeptide (TPR) repeat protein
MQKIERAYTSVMAGVAVVFLCAGGAASQEAKGAPGKIPITTTSDEARQLYLKGRDLAENLRATDSRALLEQAVAKDPAFALAHLLLANTAGTAKEFFDSMSRAKTASAKASEPERLMILGQDAGVRGDTAAQKTQLTKLVSLYPNDERAHNLIGIYSFGQQDYAGAVAHLQKATEVNPSFSPAYNMLGYSYRFLGRYPEAEKAFQKYIALIPKDPNPYDSYAELLMKMGRFKESIAQYEKALAIDPNFAASYIGISTDQILLGSSDQARNALDKLAEKSRNVGERRLAAFWTAASHVHDGAYDKALGAVQRAYALADKEGDKASLSGDLKQMGDILLESGKPDDAAAKYTQSVETINGASVPEEVKAATRRQGLFDEAEVALAKKDVKTAKLKAEAYAKEVAAKQVPFEVRQQHEINGLIALEEKDHTRAVAELKQANQQDPRVLYHLGLAYKGQGDAAKARETLTASANFNGLSFNYAYVRKRAQQALAKG